MEVAKRGMDGWRDGRTDGGTEGRTEVTRGQRDRGRGGVTEEAKERKSE